MTGAGGQPSPGRTRLLLLRHAEPEEWARGRCCGRLDPGISPEGHRQAELAARLLERQAIRAIFSSTSRRARETAAPLAARCALAPELREDLCEVSFGELEGLRFEEVQIRHPETFALWMSRPGEVHFPGGEGWAELRARAVSGLTAIRTRWPGGAIAVVTHAGVIRAALADALGLDAAAAFRIALDHAGVSALDAEGGAITVRFVNRLPAELG